MNNKNKGLASIYTILTVGSASAIYKTATSNSPDIVANRAGLLVLAVILTGIFLFLTVRHSGKASDL